ncbi:hypothetical protein QTP86_006203 [Hemibagrus guttatus]|nr:hypothetical protein QTP86_006203 [Hemibagrus guttatus]
MEDHENMNNVTESNPKGDVPDVSCHSLESTSCTEKSKNSTFDMAKDLKERFSGLNLTKPVPYESTGSSNVTFEKSVELQEKSSGLSCTISNDDASVEEKNLNEKHLNSTVDVCGLSNSITEQKLNGTVDITQSNGNRPKQEQSNEESICSKDCEKQSTFTKATEETSETVDLTAGVSTEVAQPGSVNVEQVDGTFTKHNTTTDLTPPEPVPDLTNTTMNMTKSSNTELPTQSKTNCSATVKDTPVSGPSAPVNNGAPVRVDVTDCSDRTLDLPETDGKEEEQDIFKRRNGTSDGEGYLNLDISQSSMFSLDEMLDWKPCPLVASTPIVLGRGFERLGSAKPKNIQNQLSVINSINTQLNNDTAGISEHEGSDASKSNPLSVRSDPCSQIQKVAGNNTSNSTTSEAAIVNKPQSKLVVRRKIPQPSFKSSIPKTQLPPRPSTLQSLSAAFSTTTCNPTTGIRTRISLLPGFSQKHASSDALPVAKRKKTVMLEQEGAIPKLFPQSWEHEIVQYFLTVESVHYFKRNYAHFMKNSGDSYKNMVDCQQVFDMNLL